MLKKFLFGFVLLCAIALFSCAWIKNYVYIQNAELLFLISMLAYHVFTNKKSDKLFITIISLFTISASFSVYYNYSGQLNQNYILLGNLCSLLGFTLLLIHVIRAQKFKFSKRFLKILVLVVINMVIIYYYFDLMEINNVGIMHSSLGTFYPIIKLLLISFIIGYFLSNKNLKATLIGISMLCFLLKDIAQITQFLFFMTKKVRALAILDVSFYILGVYILHQYFIKSEKDEELLD